MGIKSEASGPKITISPQVKTLGKKEAVFALVPIFL